MIVALSAISANVISFRVSWSVANARVVHLAAVLYVLDATLKDVVAIATQCNPCNAESFCLCSILEPRQLKSFDGIPEGPEAMIPTYSTI